MRTISWLRCFDKWRLVAFVAVLALTIQAVRLRALDEQLVGATNRSRDLAVINAAYEWNLLFTLREAHRESRSSRYLQIAPRNGLIAIVDSKCDACRRALMTLQAAANGRDTTVVVASFNDSAPLLRRWLQDIGWLGDLILTDLNSTPLMRLPRISPILLEFDQSEPVRISIGQPPNARGGPPTN